MTTCFNSSLPTSERNGTKGKKSYSSCVTFDLENLSICLSPSHELTDLNVFVSSVAKYRRLTTFLSAGEAERLVARGIGRDQSLLHRPRLVENQNGARRKQCFLLVLVH